MFDLFSWSHILILLTVALVVVGPKDLPRLMNIAGRWAGKARNMANEFKRSFDDMARQSELDELRAEVEKLRSNDPVADFGRDIERTLNPVDTEAAEARAAETSAADMDEAAAPRSGEYQISETPSDAPHLDEPGVAADEPSQSNPHPQTASQ
jgi:sec-independent protein translocase protein TatB